MTGVGDTPRDLGEYIRETRRRLVALERRQMPSVGEAMPGGHFYGEKRVAYLEGTYRGGGRARVRIGSLDAPLSGPYLWTVPYIPNASRVVSLTWNGTAWEIAGQPEVALDGSGYYSILDTLTGTWDTYNAWQLDRAWNERIGVNRLPTGLCVLSGLLRNSGTPSSGEVIATLPPQCRPERDIIVTINHGDSAKALTINANGTMTARTTWNSSAYLNLDGVCFWAADSEATGNWITVGTGGSSFGANFTNHDVAVWGSTRFYKDRYGWTWFDGMVKITATVSADNTNIISVPAAYRSLEELHMIGTSNDNFAGFGARNTDGLNWKGGSPGSINSWFSVSGVAVLTADADTGSKWYTSRALANSWASHGAIFPDLSWTRREDGLVQFRGLISGGSTTSAPTNYSGFPEIYPKARRIILPTLSNTVRGRWDFMGDNEDSGRNAHDVLPTAGISSAWASLDPIRYVP